MTSAKTVDLTFYIFCTKYLDFQICSIDIPSQTCLLLRSNAPRSPLSTARILQPSGAPRCLVLSWLRQWHHRWGSAVRSHLGRSVTSWLLHHYVLMPEVSLCHEEIQTTVSTEEATIIICYLYGGICSWALLPDESSCAM